MSTTYYIENSNSEIVNYFGRLSDAKRVLTTLVPNEYRIVCLKGQYKYEGRHAYFVYFNGLKFSRGVK